MLETRDLNRESKGMGCGARVLARALLSFIQLAVAIHRTMTNPHSLIDSNAPGFLEVHTQAHTLVVHDNKIHVLQFLDSFPRKSGPPSLIFRSQHQ